jgi:hypothetical protein
MKIKSIGDWISYDYQSKQGIQSTKKRIIDNLLQQKLPITIKNISNIFLTTTKNKNKNLYLVTKKEKYAIGDLIRYNLHSDLYRIVKITFPYPFTNEIGVCLISDEKIDSCNTHYYESDGCVIVQHERSFFDLQKHGKKTIMVETLINDMIKVSLEDLCQQRKSYDDFIQEEAKRLSGEK